MEGNDIGHTIGGDITVGDPCRAPLPVIKLFNITRDSVVRDADPVGRVYRMSTLPVPILHALL